MDLKRFKNLGITTGLGLIANMANGSSARDAIRTAGTSALIGEFVKDEEMAFGINTAVDVLAKQRKVATDLDRPISLQYASALTVEPSEDDSVQAKMELLSLLREFDFGRYDEIIDFVIDGLIEVKSIVRRLKDEEDGVDTPSGPSTSAADLL